MLVGGLILLGCCCSLAGFDCLGNGFGGGFGFLGFVWLRGVVWDADCVLVWVWLMWLLLLMLAVVCGFEGLFVLL